MNRYLTNIIKTDTERNRFATVILPTVPISSTDTYIRVTSMERLDKLALDFYQDSSLWWVIAAANSIPKGTIIVQPNTKLRIPSADNINNLILNINKSR